MTRIYGLFVLFWLLMVLVILGTQAHAETCGPTEACITATAPTHYEPDPTTGVSAPIPSSVPRSYNFYRAPKGSTDFRQVGQAATPGAKLVAQPKGEQCYAMTCVAGGVESNLSNQACKVIRPAAPTDGRIEAPTDGKIEVPNG